MSRVVQQAQVLLNSGDLKGAMRLVDAGLNKDPDDMAALMMAACIDAREQRWGRSYNLMKRVVEKGPPYPEALNNLGMAASSLASMTGKDRYLDEAEAALRKAYRKHPIAEVCANLALIMLHKVRLQESEKLCLECLKLDPGNVSARETLGYTYLHQAKWVEGFGNYEFTLGGKYRKIPKGKYWEKGERGKRLFVRGEQGIGDEITYASVLPEASKDNDITYECDRRLEGLMRRSLPGVEVNGARFDEVKPEYPEFDSVALTGSLCMEYRQEDEDFPRTGFLVADPERRLQWRTLLDTLPGKKVGIAWTGGLDNTFKYRRSFDLESLLPILRVPGITWVSLQYNDPSSELEAFAERHGVDIKHWKRAVEKGVDYDETAALVSELDCVVSVTTAMVHLCGALGKKCFVLVPKKARWFYSSPDTKHRWYDSLELFRQEDKWPIERVAERLKDELR
jgi:tetratricopeptide (TPR) repeat protein